MANPPRRPVNPLDAAEALFKPAKKKPEQAVERPALPNVKELVSLKIDSDVLAFSRKMALAGRIVSTIRCALR